MIASPWLQKNVGTTSDDEAMEVDSETDDESEADIEDYVTDQPSAAAEVYMYNSNYVRCMQFHIGLT